MAFDDSDAIEETQTQPSSGFDDSDAIPDESHPIEAPLAGTAAGAGNFLMKLAPFIGMGDLINKVPGVTQPLEKQIPAFSHLQKTNPNLFGGGQFVGETLPLLAAPEADAAGLLGLGLETAGKRFFGSALNSSVTNSALSAPLTAMNDPKATFGDYLTNAAEGLGIGAGVPAVTGAGKVIKNIGGRLIDVGRANAEKVGKEVSNEFENIYNTADEKKIKVTPEQHAQILKDQIETLDKGHPESLNTELLEDLNRRLKNTNPDFNRYPNAYNARDTHEQIKQLRRGAIDAKNNEAARLYNQQADALTSDLKNALPEYLKDRWVNVMNRFGEDVIPLRSDSTSLQGIAKQAALMGGIAGLPHSLGTLAAIGAGMHGADTPLANMAKRFGSTYKGGLASVLNNTSSGPITKAASRALLPYLMGGNSQ